MTEKSNKEICCPFWDKYNKKTCKLVESGLFIPTNEHILHFCENELYVKCYHYIGASSPEQRGMPEKREEKFHRNRRLYTRIPTSQKLSVSSYSLAKEAEENLLDNQAMVMDLSLGGMRIETNAPVNVNQIISFSFDEKFHPPNYKGKGEIRWIDQAESHGAPVYAGLAFVDNDTKDTVKNHLLGMGEKLLSLT